MATLPMTSSLWNTDGTMGIGNYGTKWFSCPISTLDNGIRNSGIPSNARITSLKLYVNLDQESVGAKIYVQYGFGGTGSISKYLLQGSGNGVQVGTSAADYPSGGVEISSYLINDRLSPFTITKDYGDYLAFRWYTENRLGKTFFINSVKLQITYEIPTYTATFKNYDGTTLQTVTVERGSIPSYTGSTPTRPQDAQYTYTFSGWKDDNGNSVGTITRDTTYTAQYTATLRKYSVTFKDWDGTIIPVNGQNSQTISYGGTPTKPSDPIRNKNYQYTYSFKGWSPAVGAITGNTDFVAQYNEIEREYEVIVKPHPAIEEIYNITWPVGGGGIYKYNQLITLTAEIPTYWDVSNWYSVNKKVYIENSGTTSFQLNLTEEFFNIDDTVVTFYSSISQKIVYLQKQIQPDNSGEIDAEPEGDYEEKNGYRNGTEVILTAIPNNGYKFVRWSDGITDNPRDIIVTSPYAGGRVTYTAIFEKVYVTYDTVFSFQKWKDNGIQGSNGVISNITDIGFTLTSNNGVSEAIASSPYFSVDFGKSYKIDIDISGNNWDVYIFFCDASGNWIDFNDSTNRFSSSGAGVPSRIFTAPNKAEVVKAQIRVDANGANNAVSYSNFRIFPAEYEYMSTSILATERTDSVFWSIPTPTREGYKFIGWNTKPDANGVFYTNDSEFPLEDLILYSIFRPLQMVFKSVKIYYPTETTLASPDNPLIGGDETQKAQIIVQVALE